MLILMEPNPILHAAQFGRLNFFSFFLLVLEIMIAVTAVVAVIKLRGYARAQAVKPAEEISDEIAECAANSN